MKHEKASGWFIDSVKDHIINISKNNSLAGSSHIKLQIKPSKKRLD